MIFYVFKLQIRWIRKESVQEDVTPARFPMGVTFYCFGFGMSLKLRLLSRLLAGVTVSVRIRIRAVAVAEV